MEILSFENLPSTNVHALDLARLGAAPETVVWARQQTAGRGQYKREFSSPPGGLYFSIILQPDLSRERLSQVTLAAGVGCCRCLEHLCGVSPQLKWPNDLYLNSRKVGGILTETLPLMKNKQPVVIIGAGLNINSMVDDFPDTLRPTVTTIKDCTGQAYDLRLLLESAAAEIYQQIQLLEKNQDKLLAQWDRRDYLKNHPLQWDNGQAVISGTGSGILDDGRYSFVDDAGNLHKILAGTLKPFSANR